MPDEKVKSLSEFVDRVRKIRQEHWRVLDHKELWFRGEGEKHEKSPLCPKLYRPPKVTAMKPIRELLKIENELYEDFQRCGVQLCNERIEEAYRDWDWYYLMQHHNAPTRLLDWSDGALIALHFALRDKTKDALRDEITKSLCNPIVYVLDPDRLKERLKTFPEIETIKENWKAYVKNHPFFEGREDEWEYTYVPDNEEGLKELNIPSLPLVLDFPHFTRRVAAQRSRFVVFGTDPSWLSEQFENSDSDLTSIAIDRDCVSSIRVELRESGVTESVIFPDLDGLGREMNQLWEDRKCREY
jgi:hypothetical protein